MSQLKSLSYQIYLFLLSKPLPVQALPADENPREDNKYMTKTRYHVKRGPVNKELINDQEKK